MSKIYIIIIFLISILFGCSKEPSAPQEELNPINFFCGLEQAQTKTNSVFASGNTAIIYAFASGEIAANIGGTPLNATASGSGLLAPTSTIFLPKGNYDFYSVSANNSSSPNISFTGGVSGDLANGVDYLWAGNKNTTVNNGANVTFAYKHFACQMQIRIVANPRVSGLVVNSFKFTYPITSGVKMNLSTGSISSSGSVTALSNVAGSGNTRNFICLPCTVSSQVEININATIDGQPVTNKTYRATVNQALVGGNSYDIALNMNADNAFSTTCSIIAWQNISNSITY